MQPFEERNRHFDALAGTPGLRWMGQNTNHFSPPAAVADAMRAVIEEEAYHVYAPPAGFEELRDLIVEDLGLDGMCAVVTDGAVLSLYHACRTLLRPGDTLVTTDPSWSWPMAFAKEIGATVRQVPIYGPEHGYRLDPARLESVLDDTVRLIYFVDPNNPLGTVATRTEIERLAEIVGRTDAILVHDCTYRDFADAHHLAARIAPERTITVTSFSKWLGLAGLRIGAYVTNPELAQRLAAAAPNTLGSSVLAQRAAIAGLKSKADWFPAVLAAERENQAMIKRAADQIPGLNLPVYPSNGNFVIIECGGAGIRPEALCHALAKRRILVRQGSYHTPTFGDRFIKVSTTVPAAWAEEFCTFLPEAVEQAQGINADVKLF